MRHPCCLAALLAALFVLGAGCGRRGPEVVRIKGKVTFGGGPWPAKGVLYFTPTEPADGMPRRPAPADFDTDGRFAASSFKRGDGLVPGRYRVAVECWEVAPDMQNFRIPKSYVPSRFHTAATSDLEVDIPPGAGAVEVTLDVPKR